MPSSLTKLSRETALTAALEYVEQIHQNKSQSLKHGTKTESNGKEKYNLGKKHKTDDDIEELVRTVATGIGFVSEVIKHRKTTTKLAIEQRQTEEYQDIEDSVAFATDTPQLDDHTSKHTSIPTKPHSQPADLAMEQPTHNSDPQSAFPSGAPTLSATFLTTHSLPSFPPPTSHLPLPIVIPQRRPRTRNRGFTRAYAPSLAAFGITQTLFLDFLDALNASLQASPWLHAINVAGQAGMAAPEPLSILIGLGAGVAADVAMEVQSRWCSNAFLEGVNEGLFRPRGLLCFVAVCGLGASTRAEDGVAAKSPGRSGGGLEEWKETLRCAGMMGGEGRASGYVLGRMQSRVLEGLRPSGGSFACVDYAPLIMPSSSSILDKTLGDQKACLLGNVKARKKNVFDRSEAWLGDYIDKVTTARWLHGNPDVPTAAILPKPEFNSRYADPAHPAASGDVVALLTGGKWQYKNREDGLVGGECSDRHDSPLIATGSRNEGGHVKEHAKGKTGRLKQLFEKASAVGERSRTC